MLLKVLSEVYMESRNNCRSTQKKENTKHDNEGE